jgi:hypothetical protein
MLRLLRKYPTGALYAAQYAANEELLCISLELAIVEAWAILRSGVIPEHKLDGQHALPWARSQRWEDVTAIFAESPTTKVSV